jgi:hypothetical protein
MSTGFSRMVQWLFEHLLVVHIVVGAFGLAAFWVPVIGRKGGVNHKRWGRLFAQAMLVNGVLAAGMAACTLIDPLPGHHKLTDAAVIRGVFGWMMLYLGVLTASLAWHSLAVVKNKLDHAADRAWPHVAMQAATVLTALNCLVLGVALGQPIMIAMPFIGFASAATNLWYIFKATPERGDYLIEHLKAGVGAGISCYTAFLAFGAVRYAPEHALNPIAWSVPCIIGLGIIFWHAGKRNYFARFGWRRAPRPADRTASRH